VDLEVTSVSGNRDLMVGLGGAEVNPMGLDDFGRLTAIEAARWARVAKESNIKAE
jgi:hypothetical protein